MSKNIYKTGKAHNASTLDKDYRELRNAEREKQSSAGRSTPMDYPTPSGQPRKHTYKEHID